ncbi:E3 ubiquitin-protein ligase Siah1-like [Diabrotica virgifera virgifera]|uniref:RING-type E3 ubiquitin transferase n=1 Tax=Diabrotica virgifera virgifera TaxID=50390 RepID=A0A6P7GV32_DIAVI|nr:E3 ubiquitin-protein ligase Siah1-like [Diabrotica virgifera virgifera]
MSNEDLQRELECPICLNYLQIPIRMCTTGHSLCDTCRNKLTVCPMCLSGFSNGSNRSLESIIPLLKIPCKFRDKGCQDLLFHVDRLAHEVDCPHQGISCPRCSFNSSITDMEKHCRDTHCAQNLEQYNNCSMFFFETLMGSSVNGIVQKDGKYFWLRAFKNSENNILFSVEMVGTKEEASKYSYKLIFSKEIQKICFEDTCKPLGLSNKLSAPGKSFNLSVPDIESFLEDWNISITVENIKLKHNILKLFSNYTKNKIKLVLNLLFSILLAIVLYYIMFRPK